MSLHASDDQNILKQVWCKNAAGSHNPEIILMYIFCRFALKLLTRIYTTYSNKSVCSQVAFQ